MREREKDREREEKKRRESNRKHSNIHTTSKQTFVKCENITLILFDNHHKTPTLLLLLQTNRYLLSSMQARRDREQRGGALNTKQN
jgi:hypothetical protein